MSSLLDVSVPANVCFAGEVGLSGEIRAVNRIDQRISEADRLGFKDIFISKYGTKGLDFGKYGIRVHTLGKVEELHRIGDCVAPRKAAAVVYEGERLGREI